MLNWLSRFFRKSEDSKSANQVNSSSDNSFEGGYFSLKREESISPDWDNYPDDLPPDWELRRQAVLKRDNFFCQAVGCIQYGLHLHAHHKKPRWQGGSHKLENLVALCPVHHAIVHLDTNIISVKDKRCSVVSRHWRNGAEVRANIRRRRLISPPELTQIRKHFGLKCQCGFEDWKGNFRSRLFERALIWTWCPQCNDRWEFEQGLLEETASQLASKFPPSRNLVNFTFDINLIRGLKEPLWFKGCPECLRHERRGHLLEKKGKFGKFIGCSEWPVCRYTKDL